LPFPYYLLCQERRTAVAVITAALGREIEQAWESRGDAAPVDVQVDEAGGQRQTSKVDGLGPCGRRQALAHCGDAALFEDDGGTRGLLVGGENAGVDKSNDHG
jgi:hypothetical protein